MTFGVGVVEACGGGCECLCVVVRGDICDTNVHWRGQREAALVVESGMKWYGVPFWVG